MTRARIAAAPISWGVCEVPDWGIQPDPEQFLGDVAGIGIHAIERGPVGYLPAEASGARTAASNWGLQIVGGFLPVSFATGRLAATSRETASQAIEWIAAAGGSQLVLGVTGPVGDFARREVLDDTAWEATCAGLDEIAAIASAAQVTASVHQHVGTAVETSEDLGRVLEGSSIGLCLDTGHMALGGCDSLVLVESAGERIVHVHLKDVDAERCARFRSGGYDDYLSAVRDEVYVGLGQGIAQVDAVVEALESRGYVGWYVLEHDRSLARAEDAADVRAAVARDASFVANLLTTRNAVHV